MRTIEQALAPYGVTCARVIGRWDKTIGWADNYTLSGRDQRLTLATIHQAEWRHTLRQLERMLRA